MEARGVEVEPTAFGIGLGDWITAEVKPLSVNKAYRGRRYKTSDYVRYIRDMKAVLPSMNVPPHGKLKLYVNVYYSNKGNDIDNALKPFIDILQKFYFFNDNRIYSLRVEKFMVAKGDEKIEFKLEVM